jgi:hypothetical protein
MHKQEKYPLQRFWCEAPFARRCLKLLAGLDFRTTPKISLSTLPEEKSDRGNESKKGKEQGHSARHRENQK